MANRSRQCPDLLAKEGDRGEFSSIVLELDDLSYEDGITKLKFIGGRKAFEALLAALSLRTFMRSERWKYYDRSYVKVDEERVRRAVMAALPDWYGIRLFLLRTYQARRTSADGTIGGRRTGTMQYLFPKPNTRLKGAIRRYM